MPRAETKYRTNAIEPAEYVNFQDNSTGASKQYRVYAEEGSNKELVQCDLCNRYIALRGSGTNRSLTIFNQHRGQNACLKKKNKLGHSQVEREETARAEAALQKVGLGNRLDAESSGVQSASSRSQYS